MLSLFPLMVKGCFLKPSMGRGQLGEEGNKVESLTLIDQSW